MSPTTKTTLTVNGQRHEVDVEPNTPLVFVLRNDLGLRGVRAGCSIGVCGACTVVADGEPIRSCNTPLEAVAGKDLITPEGLGSPDQPHPVQQAFLDEQAAQCAYCINGIIMSTAAAVSRHERAEEFPPAWMKEHLCRCGTHHRVLRAVRRALGGNADRGVARTDASGLSASPELHGPDGAEDPLAPDVPSDRVESWLRLLPDGRIGARTGKVELGQGIRSTMCQIVASQIGVPPECVVSLGTVTGFAPDEGYTSGSNSTDQGGVAIARAAVAFARLLRARATDVLATSSVTVRPDGVQSKDGRMMTFVDLAARGPITGPIEDTDEPNWSAAGLGQAVRRDDLRYKLTGSGAYVHDMVVSGMLHARALLPPSRNARLERLDFDAAEQMPGVVRVFVDDRLIIVIAEREEQATQALTRLRDHCAWAVEPGEVDSHSLYDHLRRLDGERYVARQADVDERPDSATHSATYSQPYQAHAAIAPSCAVAHRDGEVLRVYSHSQGVYQLRDAIAALLDVEASRVEVAHRDGPGCYGHNLADDAAAFAAIAAQAMGGSPVRFQFSVEDEFTWEPFGPAMVADLAAALDNDGRITYWSHRALTDAHSARPEGKAARLLPSWLCSARLLPDWPGAQSQGARNTEPLYDVPVIDAFADYVRGPLRSSALRSLGAYLNIFASESFMDELAEKAGADPLEFRLRHLADDRARRVLEAVAQEANWKPHVGPSGRGLGLAVARYKSVKAYVAEAVEAAIDPETAQITVKRIVIACDAGAIVNPDGARQQLEGGALQGLSRALHEEVRFDREGVTSRDWLEYPVLGFDEIPDITVVLVDAKGHPPLGVGEASIGQAAAALANAIDDAAGIPLRDLPMTPKRVTDRLFSMSEQEASRVLA